MDREVEGSDRSEVTGPVVWLLGVALITPLVLAGLSQIFHFGAMRCRQGGGAVSSPGALTGRVGDDRHPTTSSGANHRATASGIEGRLPNDARRT